MCGLAALFQAGRRFPDPLLQGIDRDLYHRGPDAGGLHREPGVALVHRRLSIIDVRAIADQPMHTDDGALTLIFNGEIYNYLDLRRELEACGAAFRTSGDTEVILQGYRHWGDTVIERLEGMFAFVIVDRPRGIAVAARDPLGIKPLYLREAPDGVVGIASEIRPLLRLGPAEPDPAALAELLQFKWAAGHLSNISGVERILPGTILKIALDGRGVSRKRYFNILDTIADGADSRQPAQQMDSLKRAIEESVSAHLMSDVGYTVQLSGGVDSSLVSAIAAAKSDRDVETFGIELPGLDENERPWRDLVVKHCGLRNHEVTMDGVSFADNLDRAVRHMEGPVPHGGCVLLMLLCDEIRKSAKVVLTGEGADEFFGGYERYGLWRKLMWQERLAAWLPTGLLPDRPPFRGIKRMAGKDAAIHASVYDNNRAFNELFPELSPVSGARSSASRAMDDFRSRLLAVDQTAYLESLLVRQDKMSMAASVESRVPFVHRPLARLANSVPHDLRIPGGETKPLLKRIADAYLPREVIYRRKVGLLLPYGDWCRDEKALGRFVDDVASESSPLRRYADGKRLDRFVADFRQGAAAETRSMFRLINVDRWLRSLKAVPTDTPDTHDAG